MDKTLVVYVIAIALGFVYYLARYYVRRRLQWLRRRPALKNTACPLVEHEWRSICAPYAKQCRKCGVVIFAEDREGRFPDGFREYFEYIDNLKKERML